MSEGSRAQAIGIFDSGMGGLTVMRALKARLPHEQFIYLGDTARLPYGTKSGETVSRYAVQAASLLVKRRVKFIVVACNTASAVALPALEAALAPVPVVGVVQPGAQAALQAAPHGPIAVIATESTVRGGAYERAIHAIDSDIAVQQIACPLFVSLAEEGLIEGPIAELVAARYLGALPNEPSLAPRALVLGCTHFPVLKDIISRTVGADIVLVDSADAVADAVVRLLSAGKLASEEPSTKADEFLVTDAPERFARLGEIFLGHAIAPETVTLVDL
ncbi:MAG TPA: glutamate racemase [Rhizomicrobium sp.]